MSSESKPADDIRIKFEGNFLDAADLTKDITLTIASVVQPNTEQDATKKNIDKWIIGFEGAKKRMILNKTNLKIIALQYGTKASDWVGKKITLTVRYLKTAFGEKNVPTVRVVPSADHPMTFSMRRNYGAAKPFTND